MDQPPFRVPPFSFSHRLSAWIGCTLEIRCACFNTSFPSMRMLLERLGDQPIEAVVPRLRCKKCGQRPVQAWLISGHHRSPFGGPPPDWAVEIIKPK